MREAEVRIFDLDEEGAGLGWKDGRPFHVWGALPGELVRVRVTSKSKGEFHGVAEEVLEPSPRRTTPLEDHFLSCSPWQIMDIQGELETKRERVESLLSSALGRPVELDIFQSPQVFGYRNKMEFSFLREKVSLAFFRRGRKGKVELPGGCALAHPAMNSVSLKLCALLRESGFPASSLKSLVVRANSAGTTLAALFLREKPGRLPFVDLPVVPWLAGLRVFYSDPRSPASVATEELADLGRSELEEEVLGRRFLFSETCFFQVNVPAFEEALRDILRFTSEAQTLYDFYSGVGTIGLSSEAKKVVLVESDLEATRWAALNAEINGVPDFEVVLERAEDFIPSAREGSVFVFDPPRTGLHKKVVSALLEKEPKRIVYLSCNPYTQARDLEAISARYGPVFLRAYNFFPGTPHVECLVVMDRLVP